MKPSFLLAASTFALLPLAPAAAQDAPSADLGEEIIVTAQKRDQKLVDVPLTVTAWSGEQMQRLGVSQFNELSAFVPGLNIQEQSANNPGFVIRGITSDSGSAQQAARADAGRPRPRDAGAGQPHRRRCAPASPRSSARSRAAATAVPSAACG